MRVTNQTHIHLRPSAFDTIGIVASEHGGTQWVAIGDDVAIFYDDLDQLRDFLQQIDNAASYAALLDESEPVAS